MAFCGGDLRLEALEPAGGDGIEAKARRDGLEAALRRGDQCDTFAAREVEVKADGAKPQPAGVPAADRVLPVGLPVDAALHADTTAGAALRSHVFLLNRMGPPHASRPERHLARAVGRLTGS